MVFSKESIYDVSETDQECLRLHFVKFETKYIETCLDFIKANLIQSEEPNKSIKVTGGGAYKYKDLITSKLGVQVCFLLFCFLYFLVNLDILQSLSASE